MIIFWFWGIYFLTLLQILRDAILLNAHIPLSWTWSRKQQSASPHCMKRAPELILLLPVLREQQQLHTMLQLLGDLPYPGKKRIIVVTTQREVAENNGDSCGTTVELAAHIIAELQHPSLYGHIHYPRVVGNKASQLNYAFREILTITQEDLSAYYIGIYDADSRPASDTLLRIWGLIANAETMDRPWPIAIQQPALFLGNFQHVSWYLQLEALFETRWVFGHEIRTLRASTRPSAQYLAPYAYCVGHGMFIRADFLQETGGFPEPSEDVPLGHRLTFLGIPIHPLPTFVVLPFWITLISTSRLQPCQRRSQRSCLPCWPTQCTTLMPRPSPSGAPLRCAALT